MQNIFLIITFLNLPVTFIISRFFQIKTFNIFHIDHFLVNCPNKRIAIVEGSKEQAYKPIDIKEVFAGKSPGMAKLIPGFFYRYIKKVLHLDEVNDFLAKNGHHKGTDFIDTVVEDFNVTEFVHNADNIPDSGKFIFASNHPLGGFDGMLLMRNVYKKLGSFKFLTNDILMNIPQLSEVFAPINKHGGHPREAARAIDNLYNSEDQVLIFPSGLASRKIKGKIMDLDWKKHFISKSIKHQRDVIPVFISGRNSDWFYRLANFRKFLHLKWNLEMFYLVDETMKHKNTDVHLYFGKPIPYSTFDSSKTHKQWADWVKEKVYKLQEEAV